MDGGFVPSLLAVLLHELTRDTSLEDLASVLPWDASQLADFEDLLRVPDGLMEQLQAGAEKMERERIRVVAPYAHDARQLLTALEKLSLLDG
jgi:hypothetical protein